MHKLEGGQSCPQPPFRRLFESRANSAGFSANIVTFLAIFSGGNLRDRDAHEPEESCLFHTPGMCLSGAPCDMRT
jgi:hypothetical protein